MPRKRCNAQNHSKISTSVKCYDPGWQNQFSVSVGGQQGRVKQSVQETCSRTVSLTPNRMSVKEVTKTVRNTTFDLNPNRRGSSNSRSLVTGNQNYQGQHYGNNDYKGQYYGYNDYKGQYYGNNYYKGKYYGN